MITNITNKDLRTSRAGFYPPLRGLKLKIKVKKREIRKELAKGHNERVGRGIVPRQCRPELYLRG